MPTSLVTAGTLPVSLTEAKNHLRVTGNDDDVLIDNLITSATTSAENDTWRRFTTQTYDVFYDNFANVEIPYGQLQSVTSVKYYDTDNVQQTLSSAVYDVDIVHDPGRVTLAYGQSWPSVYDRPNAIEIRFVCGYSTVPEDIKTAIKFKIEMLYGNLFDKEYDILDNAYTNLLTPYEIESF